MGDYPLVPDPDGKPFCAEIIDLDEIRIQYGRKPAGQATCEHRRLVYSRGERRVWCQDCERTLDGFDAFYVLTQHFEKMSAAVRRKNEKADEAMKATLTRRVTKALDRTWASGMAPCCPHCRDALLPEDMENTSSANQEWVRAGRKKRSALLAQAEAPSTSAGGKDA